jgi:excisionase family DNA binding protein
MMNEKDPLSHWVAIGEVAAYFAVSPATFRKWFAAGRIPQNAFIQVGATYRFNIAAVEVALQGGDLPEPSVPTRPTDIESEPEQEKSTAFKLY